MVTKKTSRRTTGSPNRGGRTSMTYDMSRRYPNSATPNKEEFLTDVRASRTTSSARGANPSQASQRRTATPLAQARKATPITSAVEIRKANATKARSSRKTK